MPFEEITVVADGTSYTGWESITVINEMQVTYAFAELTTTEVGGIRKDGKNDAFDLWNFPPGTQVDITASGTPVLRGIVDLYAPSIDADQHAITVSIKTFAKNFVDTSVKHDTGNFENMTDIAIVGLLASTAQVPFVSFAAADLIKYWQIKAGGSNYQEAMRILQQRGKMLWSRLPYGEMVVTDGNPFGMVTDGAIIEGQNVIKESARLTDEGYSLLEVVGQDARGTDPSQHLQPYGVALDIFTGRFRYKRIVDQAATSKILAQRRADWDMQRSLGQNLQATFVVLGWRTGGDKGPLWQPNMNVYCYAPWLKIDCVLRIWKVIFNQDSGTGTTTTITVVDERATGKKTSSPCKSGSVWRLGAR